ncbi:MAG: hypothetical protein R6U96_04545 [Promethearchaeia archaeon]
MILRQVVWEDQNDLVLGFIKQSEEDKDLDDPDNIKRLNLRYEISKRNSPAGNRNAYPVLVSVKDFHIIQQAMAFSISLDRIIDPKDLQIFFSKLTIIFHSGKRKEIFINKRYRMSDIETDEDFFTEFYTAQEEELENFFSNSITHEEVYEEIETDVQNDQKRKRVIYKRNQTRVSSSHNNQQMTELLRKNNQRLQNVEKALNSLTKTLQNLDGLNLNTDNSLRSSPLPPPPPSSGEIKKPKNKTSSKNTISSFSKRKKKSITPKGSKMAFLGELKEVLSSSKKKSGRFNFHDVLKPMSDDELNDVTLKEEELEKRENDYVSRNIIKQEQTEEE